MYVDPFWCGFLLGFVTALIIFILLCYDAGKRGKK